jgi:glycosyltransferase involved in cell wall biosynthesis
MYDMLYEDNAGILIDPIDYNEIAVKILNLLHQPTLIGEYGTRARYTVIKKYNKGIIGNKIEKEFFKYSGLLLI